MPDYNTIPVTPPGATQMTVNRLAPGTNYEFMVVGKNALGEGMRSKPITVKTVGKWHTIILPFMGNKIGGGGLSPLPLNINNTSIT